MREGKRVLCRRITRYTITNRSSYLEAAVCARMSSRDENIYGGNWSVKKLDCVEDYVVSYLRVMQKQRLLAS